MVKQTTGFQCGVCDTVYSEESLATQCESLPATDFGYEIGREIPLKLSKTTGIIISRWREVFTKSGRHLNNYLLQIAGPDKTRTVHFHEKALDVMTSVIKPKNIGDIIKYYKDSGYL